MDYLCEFCGAAFEGNPAACGLEVCADCCTECKAEDGLCAAVEAMK
ncbi:MAG: hypothetical protein RRZ24_11520 [Clostridia bacterium]